MDKSTVILQNGERLGNPGQLAAILNRRPVQVICCIPSTTIEAVLDTLAGEMAELAAAQGVSVDQLQVNAVELLDDFRAAILAPAMDKVR